ncbi:Holliday junction DNA helicase RuvA [Candidatus Kaiserbacteria bacterium RIFCSPHIGHO2_02_FULL_50_9]|uniref:Holliday junction branch migration complex subunit RuvA n=1 Tax=Candidatus Kaiserbacteria bacterium RIFCSPLOWO2_01_FULL_51_21 TaxID=1798508 RepID=A0A1F6ED91_9BACT|nr:MAG: Holliday junction DNA helicase RuvA [Candidatus Kaiserbacteria bacterium RIFCSPHIGHO2_01_FULL_51_33]OGG63759.1 MAG: Holliday junction DNA helicase RuvA [Candidatus Kaiserbacteria bacterium RIFCSPHIGHO2_02_FULL_50_9]OGG71638.1 MAG: Holliday junction DNA helicase RuvA [Candidatus Kaiserbacteria bacterium RIFCSPLOWO2_01_FULL_51_21]
MIGQLSGTIARHADGFVMLDVGGVGYKIRVTATVYQSLAHEREQVTLFTHLAVRENALDLYGFQDMRELRFFELLISVSGIGPKTAIAILSIADVGTIVAAVSEGNSAYLTKVAGIGRKIAEKIVLELRDKLGAVEPGEGTLGIKDDADVLEALRSLGYQSAEAREALKRIPKETMGAGGRLKAALKTLSAK